MTERDHCLARPRIPGRDFVTRNFMTLNDVRQTVLGGGVVCAGRTELAVGLSGRTEGTLTR